MKAHVWAAVMIGLFASSQLQAADAEAKLPIEEALYVPLGGIDQWITIRSRNPKAPVLLWIHGGPTDIQSPMVSVYEPWTEGFTLVQWDQRGAGKTFRKNPGPASDVSLERIAQDGVELVEHLQKRLSVQRIILAGHSWGSLVGITMLQKRPELFDAFIGAGQVNSWRETVKWQYDYALQKAREAGDAAVVQELGTAGAPPHDNTGKYFAMRRRLAAYFPKVDVQWIEQEQKLYESEPGATAEDIKAYAAGGAFSASKLMPTIMSTDLASTISTVDTRFCVIQGELDTFTPTALAHAFFDKVQAPKKYFAVIPHAGHFAAMTHTAEFLGDITRCLAK
jgi:pimeloyl-ACP methyl ester carboxylesterase